jgi:hypothetical protein
MSKKYIIVNISELDKINFDEVLETSSETLHKSYDEQKFFIKWEGDNPSFYDSLETKSIIYTNIEMLDILSTEEWTGPEIISGTTIN